MPEGSIWNPWKPGKDDRQLKVKVLVLNYDPLVPSEQNRRLSDVFRWNSPERLATQYKAEMEFASGGYLRFEIVEWRNLNEIYAQRDRHRYTPDEYTFNRRNNGGWHDGGGQDYPWVMEEQGVAELIDAGVIDEVWIFSDHYFGLWEASMAGPGAFFINGGVYPEVPSQRPFAFYGFNYERGVPEMMHNTCHRTEATMNRVYGQWNLKEPKSNWDKFSANDRQSNGVAGVGTCHWPANAESDYDYGNKRVVQSWADDFLNYPDLTFTKKPVSVATWARPTGVPQTGYMSWYFAHVPRAPGVNPDGRQNNWWKYIMDFQNYDGTGKPLPLAARAQARDVYAPRKTDVQFQVAYSGAVAVDVKSLDDVVVAGPEKFQQPARLVGVSDPSHGTHRVATYTVAAPAGGWQAKHRGEYRIEIQGNQVRDVAGKALTAKSVGSFQARTTDQEKLDRLESDADKIELTIGEVQRLNLVGVSTDDSRQDASRAAIWMSGNPRVVSVDETGRIRGMSAGDAIITAELGSLVQRISMIVKESGGPRAKLGKTPDHTASDQPYRFTVEYAAEDDLLVDTIGFGDVRVRGPNGFQQFPEFVKADGANPKARSATYEVSPPGGRWWSSGNGEYAVELKGWQVAAGKNQFAAESRLGTFRVDVKESEPDGPPPTIGADELRRNKAARKNRPKNAGKKK